MRHLPPPRAAVLLATGAIELAMGVALGFSWSQRHDPLHAVLAITLLICGTVTVILGRRPRDAPDGEDRDRQEDTELVHLDRSSLPGEDEADRRRGIDADQVPTLGELVAWIEQNHYLPPTPGGHWVLRRRGQKAALIVCPAGTFTTRLLVPAEQAVAPGSHWSIAHEKH
ncbi:MAG: hypothetical protein E7Z97_03870 [Propionibacteriaceae bacterium]|nr:hypothetical protein [Propionibacteriaceae bacterium]